MTQRSRLNDSTLTAALLRAAEIELGVELAAYDHVMQAVRTTSQRRSAIPAISLRPRSLVLLAVLALLIASAGIVAMGALRRPVPRPAPMQIYHHNGVILTWDGMSFGVSEPDGSPRRERLELPPMRPGQASWSPDGAQLVASGDAGVQVGDIATRTVRTIWTCDPVCGAVEWSPDGRTIAIADASAILLVSPSGSEQGEVTLPGHSIDALSWSPDSALIAVAVDRPEPHVPRGGDSPVAHGTSGLLIVGRDGAIVGSLEAVRGDGARIQDLSWSPDGQSIAYIAGQWQQCCAFQFSLRTIQPDGGGRRALAEAGGCYCAGLAPPGVAWSPDGELIAFGRAGMGLYVIRPDGGNARLISQTYYLPAWRPVP